MLLFALFSFASQREIRVLVFTKTAGFEHGSISTGVAVLLQMGKENGFRVDTTKNAAYFVEDSLKHYDVVVFLNSTGDVLNEQQQAHFEHFIQAGGGFVGIHAAADTEFHWPWYGQLVGAYFDDHPRVQKATINIIDTNHVATSHLPSRWERRDEWYNYKSISSKIEVLATLDEETYEGGTNGAYHPIIWCQEYDGGRSFYSGLGHTNESFQNLDFQKLLLKGILWAAGENISYLSGK